MPKDANKNKKEKKEKKHFFKDFKAELKKVIWPTPKQLVNNTVAVVTIVLITAVIVFVLDVVFESMNTYGINKLKELVSTNAEVTNTVEDTNTVENTNTETTDSTENTESVDNTENVENAENQENTEGNTSSENVSE